MERYCPIPSAALELGTLARWRHVRDGLKLVIEMLPFDERRLSERLQEHWAYCCMKVEEFQAKEPPEWLLPY
jgi:hypothetical protein